MNLFNIYIISIFAYICEGYTLWLYCSGLFELQIQFYKKIVNLHNILHYSYIVYRFTHIFIKLYTVFCNDNADYMHSI